MFQCSVMYFLCSRAQSYVPSSSIQSCVCFVFGSTQLCFLCSSVQSSTCCISFALVSSHVFALSLGPVVLVLCQGHVMFLFCPRVHSYVCFVQESSCVMFQN